MSKRYPRSIRMTDDDWNTLKKLAEIAEITRSVLIENMLQGFIVILTKGLDLEKTSDQQAIRVMLKRIVD